MLIATYNTWKSDGAYRVRLPAMAAGLAATGADVICLQEVFAGAGHDTAGRIAAASGFVAAHLPLRAKPRLCEGEETASTSGLAVLSRWPLSDVQPLLLSSDPRDGERAALAVTVDAPDGAVRVVCLHLTHLGGATGAQLRARQLGELLGAVDAGAKPVLLAGDFNGEWSDAELALCREHPDCMARPIAAEAGGTLIGERAGARPQPARSIDHVVLVGGAAAGLTLVETRLALDQPIGADGLHASDHAAVLARLAVRKTGATAPR